MKGIIFKNIKTGEEREVVGLSHIAAFWSSSDMSPNSAKGQDFGWRIEPKAKAGLEAAKKDLTRLEEIATSMKVSVDNITDSHILFDIVNKRIRAERLKQVDTTEDKSDEMAEKYDEEVKKELNKIKKAKEPKETAEPIKETKAAEKNTKETKVNNK